MRVNYGLANSFSPPAEDCLQIRGALPGTGQGGSSPLSFTVCWYLYGIDLVHPGWLALRHTFQFDELEKIDRAKQCSCTRVESDRETGFGSLLGTPFNNWIGFSLRPILLIVALETHPKKLQGAEMPAWGNWGQMMPLTMFVLGVGPWLYLNVSQFYDHTRRRTGVLADSRTIPLDTSRLIAMGVESIEMDEGFYELLTAKESDSARLD